MPLYEYQCGRCGRFELICKFSDPPLDKCPTCEGEIQKLISSPAIQFKGAGWYVTDYAKKSGGDGSSKGGESKGESKNESKSESKSGESKSDSASTSTSTPSPAKKTD